MEKAGEVDQMQAGTVPSAKSTPVKSPDAKRPKVSKKPTVEPVVEPRRLEPELKVSVEVPAKVEQQSSTPTRPETSVSWPCYL